jgi:16S rRNA G527 N7-methylase RsmG
VIQAELSSLNTVCDVATYRAVAPLSRFLEDAARGGFSAGCVAAYKGRLDRTRQEIEDVQRSTAGRCEAEIVPLVVPFLDEERCIALLRFSSLLTNR